MPQVAISHNKDGTITVRYAGKVEHISTQDKTQAQIFDAVKWAAITQGAIISDIRLIEMLQHNGR